MNTDRETLLLKAIISIILEPIWKSEFYNDAEDHILYNDPEIKKNPRSESEINQMISELNRIKNDLLDEIVDDFQEKGIVTIEDIAQNEKRVQEICHTRFSRYRRDLWDVVGSEFPPK